MGAGMEIVRQRRPPTANRRHLASVLYQKTIWEPAREPCVPVDTLRTGHSWLSTYAKTFGFREDDQCVCGAHETVTPVLVDCPNLREIRRELRCEVGDAFGSMSSLLGGSIEGKRGKPDTVSRAETVKAVLDFAEASQRFCSRAPQGQPNNGNGS
ncbi:hypothetical protein N7510_002669 [Penicillium lagena]|uniref:uncharacterized protein n=1 Tax=Penicillium lagena TaxID=94218 RepID=UPI00253F887B|nr:uncharacterized protein N7510_002669 [Penicillium lagena]KAJ5626360.1 hypothetical protein N7510_002669 [Penicillium lagena]